MRRIRSSDVLKRVLQKIQEIEGALALTQVTGIRRIAGGSHHYRVRIGDYRLSATVEGDLVTLLRFLHRRDIYRYFP